MLPLVLPVLQLAMARKRCTGVPSFGATATLLLSHETNNNSWTVRVNGGVRFTSGSTNLNQNVQWAPGGGAWVFSSDRNLKENFQSVDARDVLDRLANMPMTVWNYKGYGEKHLGPMTRFFNREFGLGSTETTLNSLDLDGVALTAIQGLYEVVQEQKKEIERLRAEMDELKGAHY